MLTLTAIAAALCFFASLPPGFRDQGLTISGAQGAVTVNLFFLAVGAAYAAVLSHANSVEVCPPGDPSQYWFYMVR